MITFNNPEDSKRRQNVEPLSVDDIKRLIYWLTHITQVTYYTKNNNEIAEIDEVKDLQRLFDHYSNLLHLSSNVGGWEGLAKHQEIADKQK